ncbi:hypothetical protein [uncultured Castellaniella sp.]|jgi:hypothetical protein|uniref:hypothetical protein n=1 Tax=uncultured Castellaniella sp. TaxID=647907 RepID=UPI002610CC11|nr:hypothetical protein [uncultured Castellaniella sp.]
MSWRLIFAILLLAAGVSAWGGLRLGDWLIIHSPAQVKTTEPPVELTNTPVLDANGKPFIASAPQPLADGRQGVPSLPPPVDWKVQPAPLMDEHRPIALATTTISMDEAIALATQSQQDDSGLQGIANVGTLVTNQPVQPIDVPPPPPPPNTSDAMAAGGNNWQVPFQAELKVCESMGFFSRPSCAWAARNKYCEAHQAWGKAKDCPAQH